MKSVQVTQSKSRLAPRRVSTKMVQVKYMQNCRLEKERTDSQRFLLFLPDDEILLEEPENVLATGGVARESVVSVGMEQKALLCR